MRRRGPRVVAVIVLSALVAAACSAPAATAPQAVTVTVSTLPGSGDSIADRVYRATAVRIGEPMGAIPEPADSVQYKSSPPAGNYLLERVVRVAAGTPEWSLEGSPLYTTNRRTQRVATFTFHDGSVLTLVACAVGRLGQRSKLQAAGVARAGGPGSGDTVADRVCRAADVQVGEWVGWAAQSWLTLLFRGSYAYADVRQAIGRQPHEWALGKPAIVGDRGRQRFVRCEFSDGSALVLVGTPTDPNHAMQEWMLDAVEVTRPGMLSPAGP